MGVKIRIVHESESVKITAYQIPGCPFYIRWAGDEEKKEFVRNIGLDHLCIGVGTREEVEKLHEIVKTHDVLITREPRDYPEYGDKYYAFYFRDPDGFPLEIVCQ